MHTIKMRAALAALAVSAIVVPVGARGASSHEVVLKGLRFHPSTITINPGESVTWVWQDGNVEHNVTGGSFRSRTQTHGSFTVRFTHAGTYNYRCTIHEGMVGKVVVR